MIYTSYYNYIKNKNIKNEDLISISRTAPKWFKGSYMYALAPSYELIKLNLSKSKYEKIYIKDNLKKIDIKSIAKSLQNKILLCWESEFEQCHRSILVEYLLKNGIEASEYKITIVEKKEDAVEDLLLF